MKARRWLSLILAAVMVIGMLPMSVLAADETEPAVEGAIELELDGSYTFGEPGSIEAEFLFTPEEDGAYVFYTFTDGCQSDTPAVTVYAADGVNAEADGFYGGHIDDRTVAAWYFTGTADEQYTIHYASESWDVVEVYLTTRQIAQEVCINVDHCEMKAGGTWDLQVDMNSPLTHDDYYTWSSSNHDVVEVAPYGGTGTYGRNFGALLHAVGVGEATVTVTGYPSGQSASVTVSSTAPDYVLALNSP